MAFKFYSSIVAQTVPAFVDRGNIKKWGCNNSSSYIPSGCIMLEYYSGGDYNNIVYVPWYNGKTYINYCYSGNQNYFYNSRFGRSLKKIDLQYVPFNAQRMTLSFVNCIYLNYIVNINNSVTHMNDTFQNCSSLNYNLKLPKNVTNLDRTFNNCRALNQNILIPSKVKMMAWGFYRCTNLNQNIRIPSSVTNIIGIFDSCSNLNQTIEVPKSVVDMQYSFQYCYNLRRVNVLSTEITGGKSLNAFAGNNTKAKEVYIYYKYANGEYTKTYNQVVLGNYGTGTNAQQKWHGRNNVTVKDLGTAPW